ncbi:MAG: exodeoxyribonuclease VII small subunit [Rikenellaceae bacterium]
MKKNEITYNAAVESIEEIIEKLGDNQMDVDLLSKEVKRASELIAICKEKLRDASKGVEDIVKS